MSEIIIKLDDAHAALLLHLINLVKEEAYFEDNGIAEICIELERQLPE